MNPTMTNDERRYCSAATQIGITVGEYLEKRAQGLKWCAGKKHWEPLSGFVGNVTARDGLAFECRKCQKARTEANRARNRERNLARQSSVT
jgi:hypothetical protein